MKWNTRFNPTACGPQHVGHLYMALVNEAEARNSGGKFTVRIDDTQEYWNHSLGKGLVDQFAKEYREQLERFMKIDVWERQSSMPSMQDIVGNNPFLDTFSKPKWLHDQVAEWTIDPDMAMYPYAPCFTVEKVVWDFHEHVNWLIRGEDLATEISLYDYFVDVLGLPRMKHTLLPRLRAVNRAELMVSGVSKSFGNYRLQTQIDKFGITKVLKYLAESCLVDPKGDFYVENIKWNPTIVGFEQ